MVENRWTRFRTAIVVGGKNGVNSKFESEKTYGCFTRSGGEIDAFAGAQQTCFAATQSFLRCCGGTLSNSCRVARTSRGCSVRVTEAPAAAKAPGARL